MRRLVVTAAVAAVLSGCGGGYHRLTPPLVDMTGVDQNRYNNDASECTRRKEQASFVGAATMISDCMEAKGYRVLEKKG